MAALIGDLYSMNRQAAAPINTNVPNLNQYFPQEEEEKENEPQIGQQSPEPSGMALKEQETADTKLNQVLETKRLWLGDDYQFNEIEAKTIKALALNSENPDDAVSRYIAASGVSSMTGMSVNYAYTNLDNISEYYTGHSFEAKDVGMWTKIKAGFERVELMSMKDEWMKLDIAGKTDEAAALEKKIMEKEAATADLLSALPTSAYDKIETAVLTNLGYIGVPTAKGIATGAAAGITMKSMLGAAVAAGSINPVAGAVISAVSIPILTYATLRGTAGLEMAKYTRGEDYWSYMHDNGDGPGNKTLAAALAGLNGIATMLIETLTDGVFSRGLNIAGKAMTKTGVDYTANLGVQALVELGKKGTWSNLAARIVDWVTGALDEGFINELPEYVLGEVFNAIYRKANAIPDDKTWEDIKAEAWESIWQGIIVGAVYGTGEVALDMMLNKDLSIQLRREANSSKSWTEFVERTNGIRPKKIEQEVYDKAREQIYKASVEQKADVMKQVFSGSVYESESIAMEELYSTVDSMGVEQSKVLPDGSVYRTESKDLYSKVIQDSSTSYTVAFGDRNTGAVYGTVNVRTDGNVQTITGVRVRHGYENIRTEMVRDAIAQTRSTESDVQWNPTTPGLQSVKDTLVETNPRGKDYGLNFEAKAVGEDSDIKAMALEIRKNAPNLTEQEALVSARLQAITGSGFKVDSVDNITQEQLAGRTDRNFNAATSQAKSLIYLGQQSNVSSFTHELFHAVTSVRQNESAELSSAIRETLNDETRKAQFTSFINDHKEIWEKANDDSSVDEIMARFEQIAGNESTWSPKLEEDLARLWEAYVSSPNSVKNSIPGRIKVLLQKLADLMKQVYRTLRNGVALDPEIAKAYNKLMNLEEGNKAENTGKTSDESETKTDNKLMYQESQDSRYLAAVERGDMETAQRMVDAKAAQKGYVTREDYRDSHVAPGANIGREDFTNLDKLRELRDDSFDLNLYAIANGITSQPEDYFTPIGLRYYGTNDPMADRQSFYAIMDAIRKVRDMKDGDPIPEITVYRAVPRDIKGKQLESDGQWVTPSRYYAKLHGEGRFEGKYRIIEQSVPVTELWWDGNDANEWGFDDGRPSVYKNIPNNRKLTDAVTYDDDGNVIPLSKRFTQNNPDIRYQDNDGSTTVSQKQDGTLILTHTLSINNLNRSIDNGGFPMPSLAMYPPADGNVGRAVHYGDVVLMGDSKLASELIEEKSVWDRDIWSPVYPKPEYKINKNKIQAWLNKVQAPFEIKGESPLTLGMLAEYQYSSPDGLASALSPAHSHPLLAAAYLADKGINLEIPYTSVKNPFYSEETLRHAKRWMDDNGVELYVPSDRWNEFYDYMYDYLKADAEEKQADHDRMMSRIKKKPWHHDMEYLTNPNFEYANTARNIDAITRAAVAQGKTVVDTRKLSDTIDELVDSEGYTDWIKSKTSVAYSEPLLKVGRTWRPYNTQSVFELMKSQKIKSNGDAFSELSTSWISSNAATNLKTREDIRKFESLLEWQDTNDEELNDVRREMHGRAMELSHSSDWLSQTSFADSATRSVTEFISKKYKTEAALKKVLSWSKELSNDKEFIGYAMKFADMIRNIPRVYFEAKPQRILGLSDFNTAVVPEGIDSETLSKIEQAGLSVIKYKEGEKEAAVQNAARNNNRLMFQDNSKNTSVITSPNGSLMLIHSMTASKLSRAIEVGGLPMPSLAITKPENEVVEPTLNYGEVTFIGNSRMASRVIDEGVVWDRDIWSPTYPSPQYKVNVKGLEKKLATLQKGLLPNAKWGKVATTELWMDHQYDSPDMLYSKFRDPGSYPTIGMAYLKEKGVSVDVPVELQKDDTYSFETLSKAREWLEDNDLTSNNYKSLIEYVDNELQDDANSFARKMLNKTSKGLFTLSPEESEELRNLKEMVKNDADLGFSNSFGTANSIVSAVNRTNGTNIDYNLLSKRINALVEDKSDYESWLERQFGPFYSEPMLKIGKTWKEYTIYNILEYMKKQGSIAYTMFGYADSGLSSLAAKNLKSRKAISDMEQYIKSDTEYLGLLNTAENVFVEAVNVIAKNNRENPFSAMNDIRDEAIAEYLKKGYKTPEKMKSLLWDEYAQSEDVVNATYNYAELLKNPPRKYFEAKPKRIITVSDFDTAVVPVGLDEKTKQYLINQGLNVVEYEQGKQTEAVIEAAKNNPGLMFQDNGDLNPDAIIENMDSVEDQESMESVSDDWIVEEVEIMNDGHSFSMEYPEDWDDVPDFDDDAVDQEKKLQTETPKTPSKYLKNTDNTDMTFEQFAKENAPQVVYEGNEEQKDQQFREAIQDETNLRGYLGIIGEALLVDTPSVNAYYEQQFNKTYKRYQDALMVEPFIDEKYRLGLQSRVSRQVNDADVRRAAKYSVEGKDFPVTTGLAEKVRKELSDNARFYRNILAPLIGDKSMLPDTLIEADTKLDLPGRSDMDLMAVSELADIASKYASQAVADKIMDGSLKFGTDEDERIYKEVRETIKSQTDEIKGYEKQVKELEDSNAKLNEGLDRMQTALDERDSLLQDSFQILDELRSTILGDEKSSGRTQLDERYSTLWGELYNLNEEKEYQKAATAKGSRDKGKAIGASIGTALWMNDLKALYPQLFVSDDGHGMVWQRGKSTKDNAEIRKNIDARREAVKAEMDSIRAEIARGTVRGLMANSIKVSSALSSLKKAVEGISTILSKEEVEQWNSRISELEAQNRELSDSVKELTDSKETEKEKLEAKVEKLQKKVESLQEQKVQAVNDAVLLTRWKEQKKKLAAEKRAEIAEANRKYREKKTEEVRKQAEADKAYDKETLRRWIEAKKENERKRQKAIDDANRKYAEETKRLWLEAKQQNTLENMARKVREEQRDIYRKRIQGIRETNAIAIATARAKLFETRRKERQLSQIRMEKQKIASQIMKPVNLKTTDYDTSAKAIVAIQALIDPSFKREWVYDISKNPGQVADLKGYGTMTIDEAKAYFNGLDDAQRIGISQYLSPSLLDRLTGQKKPLNDWTISELKDLASQVQALRDKGKLVLSAKKEAETARDNAIRKAIVNAIQNRIKSKDKTLPGSIERQKEQNKFSVKLQSWLYATYRPQELAQLLDGGFGYHGAAYRLLIDDKRYHQNREWRAVEKRLNKVDPLLTDKVIDQLVDTVTIDLGRGYSRTFTIDELAYVYLAKNDDSNHDAVAYGALMDEYEKGTRIADVEDPLTGENIRQFLFQNPELIVDDNELEQVGRDRFNTVYKIAKQELESRELMDVVKAISDDFNDAGNKERLNRASIEAYNVPLDARDYYLSIRRIDSKGDAILDDAVNGILDVGTNTVIANPEGGFMITRKVIRPRNQGNIDLSLIGNWRRAVADQEHLIENAAYVKQLRSVFASRTSKEVARAIDQAYGTSLRKEIVDYIELIANPNKSEPKTNFDKAVKAFRGRTGAAYLGWKTSGIILQGITSPMPGLSEINPAKLTAAYLQIGAHPIETINMINEKSIFMKKRTMDMIVDEAIQRRSQWNQNRFQKIMNKQEEIGQIGLTLVDRYAVAGNWLAMYNMALQENLENGMDTAVAEAAAVQRADNFILRTQPVGDSTEMASMFRKGNELTKAVLQFQASLNVIWNNIVPDTIGFARNKEYGKIVGTMVGYAMAGVILGLVADGFDDDDDTKKKILKLSYWAITQQLSSVPLVSVSGIDGLVQKLITGKSEYSGVGVTIFPGVDKTVQAITAMSQGNWGKAASKAGEAAGIFLGAPTSAIKQYARAATGDWMALLGR